MKSNKYLFLILIIILGCEFREALASETSFRSKVGQKGIVVSDDPVASRYGAEILKRGGNAVDAAIATAFMLSVTRPYFASIGGGGFLLYCPHKPKNIKKDCRVVDYRETAPKASTQDMYIKDGKPQSEQSLNGAKAIAVPGVVRGLLYALKKYGTLDRKEILRGPIKTAQKGMILSGFGSHAAKQVWKLFNPEAKLIFGKSPPLAGTLILQKNLARVLQTISDKGESGFYEGWVAKNIVDSLKGDGGILTLDDLKQYQPKEREPLVGKFHDYQVVTMPPPSSGGIVLLQLLRFTEMGLKSKDQLKDISALEIHTLAHAMGLGFEDRSQYLGDPDFVDIPIKKLLNEKYLKERWESTYSKSNKMSVKTGQKLTQDGKHSTTHLSVVDEKGNSVSITTTLNTDYGSKHMASGTGIFFNNQMDDFVIAPNVSNSYGLTGNKSNFIEPGKKPLSSMSPTIIFDSDNRLRFVIGAMGGPRIITSVFLSLVNRIIFNASLQDAVAAPRFHYQWQPDQLALEEGRFSFETRQALKKIGYELSLTGVSQIHAIEKSESGEVYGVADPRAEGLATLQEEVF